MVSPCAHCKKAGCGSYHDVCPEYRKWREKLKKANAAKAKEDDATRYQIHRAIEAKKGKGH